MNTRYVLFLVLLSILIIACSHKDQPENISFDSTSIPTRNPSEPEPTITAVPTEEIVIEPTATATAVPPTATAITPPPETVTMLTEDGEEIQVQLPPPDGIQTMLANAEAGLYTLPDAVIAALQQYSGEESEIELFPNQSKPPLDGWRLSSLAATVYANAAPAEQAEIERLYNKIIPSPELLETISAPAEQSSSLRGTQLGKPRAQTDCLSLWETGFPEEPARCLLYLEFSEFGHTYRVYYPESRHDDETFLPYAQAAADALRDSVRVYGELSELQDINLIFTLLTPSEETEADTAAIVPGLTPGQILRAPCPILVMPLGLHGPTDDTFKQLIAHEVFHCVQYWRQDRSASAAADWYIEGMAEYFSGVVYPDANNEHEYLSGFNFFTASESILNLQYSSWVFFQYLGDRFGKEFVVGMLDILPTSGGLPTQAAALAGIGDMPGVFHEFGQAFLDRQLQDENGSALSMRPYFLPRSRFILNPGDRQLTAHPFQLARYQLTYEEAKEYLINLDTSAGSGRLTARQINETGSWGDLPLATRIGCDDVVYLGLMTNTDAASDHTVSAETEWLDEYMCDRCLIGTWMQDTAVIEDNFRWLADGANVMSVRGQFFLEIDETTMVFTPRDYGVQIDNDGEVVDFAIEGSSSSTYVIPAENQIYAAQGSFDFTATVTNSAGTFTIVLGPEALGMIPSLSTFGPSDPLNPGDAPSPEELAGGASSTETESYFGYECTETTLTSFPPPGTSPITSSTFDRISGSAP